MVAVEISEFEKNNDDYWDGVKLYKKIIHKVLSIIEAIYL